MAGYGDGSDGALNVTSGTYYLNLDQKYQFTSINISSGATLTTNNTSGAVMYLLCQGTCTIAGAIDLHNVVQEGDASWECTIDGTTYTSPGVAPGGNGGNSWSGPSNNYLSYGGIQGQGFGGGGSGGGTTYGYVYYPGNGGNGGPASGRGGASASASVTAGLSKEIPGNTGGVSAGGSGPLFLQYGGSAGHTASGSSGAGGNAYGANGGNAIYNSGGSSGAVILGGGGGAGGVAGKAGVHIVIKAQNIVFTGTINTSGTNGGNGGTGGSGINNTSGAFASNGADGGGGGGGNSGDVYLVSNSSSIDGQVSMSGGAAGISSTISLNGSKGTDGTLYLDVPIVVDDDKLLFLSGWDIDQLVATNTVSVSTSGVTQLIDFSALSLPSNPVFEVQFKPTGSNAFYASGASSTDGTLASLFSFYAYTQNSKLYINTNGSGVARYFLWSDKVDY